MKLGLRQTVALRMISISGGSMVPLLEHDDTVMLGYSQTRPSPADIFILDDGVDLFAKRIEIIPNTTPQMLRISLKIWGVAVTSGGLMRCISSGVWYCLHVTCN
jgi:hypothetical protein